MATLSLPTDPTDLTPGLLNSLFQKQGLAAEITSFLVTESHAWGGGQASSAGRICVTVDYAAGLRAGLPRNLVLKVARATRDNSAVPDPIAGAGGALYRNEVAIYTGLRPSEFLEAPKCLGGAYDPGSNAMVLILEDMRDRGVTFPHVNVPTSLHRMQSLLDQLAILHARFWNSPALDATLGWMEAHTRGVIHDQFSSPHVLPPHIARELEANQFKREMVERLGVGADDLLRQVHRLQRHQATLAQTVCHGDTHIGNTYVVPGDGGGLFDWQLTSKGFALHDVSYLIATGLTVGERRRQEGDLLRYYRERLLEHGARDVPPIDALWVEYCRAMVWGVCIGWLITPMVNYGWDITVMAHLRTMTAYEDLEAGKLIDALG